MIFFWPSKLSMVRFVSVTTSMRPASVICDTLKVGGKPWVSTNACFTGVIDEVRVYNKALRPEVIKTIYLSGRPPSTWYWYVLGFMLLLATVG